MTTSCSWAKPGANPYRGTLEAALDRYGFTELEKAQVISRHKRIDFDTYVVIRKDEILSPFNGKAWNLRDMHWGNTYCAGEVDRSAWSKVHQEMALVYCVAPGSTKCVAIPSVCGNVSRIEWQPAPKVEPQIRPEYDDYIPQKPLPFDAPKQPDGVIPEPGTAWLVLAAAIVAVAIRRFK